MYPKPRIPLSADPDKQANIIQCLAIGCPTRTVARYFHLHPNTLVRFIRNNADFQARLQDARIEAILEYTACLRKAAKTDWRAAAWLLHRSRAALRSFMALTDPDLQDE